MKRVCLLYHCFSFELLQSMTEINTYVFVYRCCMSGHSGLKVSD